jgi:hypothetical protein
MLYINKNGHNQELTVEEGDLIANKIINGSLSINDKELFIEALQSDVHIYMNITNSNCVWRTSILKLKEITVYAQ